MPPSSTFEIPQVENLYTVPGTLKAAADAIPSEIFVTDYTPKSIQQFATADLDKVAELAHSDSVTWIDVQGLGDVPLLKQVAALFEIHPLALADIVNVPQRPKFEIFESHLLLVLKMPHLVSERFVDEQVSLAIGPRYVLSFQEDPSLDGFAAVGDRIRRRKGTIRQRGADYLASALIDVAIDSYFPILEHYGDRLEALEIQAAGSPDRDTLTAIYAVKRDLLALRRALWPLRDALNSLLRDGETAISQPVRAYLRDSYDHAVQAIDLTEIYRELSSGLIDLYLSSVSHRMNEVVQLLTLVSTIFIPLTFVAGIYGMNFNPEASPWNMPELNWPLGYPLVWLVMIAIASTLIFLFWKRGWLKLG